MKSILFSATLLAAFLNFSSCTKPNSDGSTPDKSAPQAGFVTGKVVDSQGKPLAGAEITANSSTYYNNTATGYSDANGNYRIGIPTGAMAGSFYVHGTVMLTFENKKYKMALYTEEDGTFMGEDGAVRNLRLKLSGDRDNFADSGYYGGTVEVDNHTEGNYVNTSDIELNFEPVALIDGSVGQELYGRPTGLYLRDIPLGRYKITAHQASTKRPLTVRIRLKGQDYQSSVSGVFEPILSGSDRYQMDVEVAN